MTCLGDPINSPDKFTTVFLDSWQAESAFAGTSHTLFAPYKSLTLMMQPRRWETGYTRRLAMLRQFGTLKSTSFSLSLYIYIYLSIYLFLPRDEFILPFTVYISSHFQKRRAFTRSLCSLNTGNNILDTNRCNLNKHNWKTIIFLSKHKSRRWFWFEKKCSYLSSNWSRRENLCIVSTGLIVNIDIRANSRFYLYDEQSEAC